MKQLEQSGERLTTSLEYPLGELLPLSAELKKKRESVSLFRQVLDPEVELV
jgi:hypothetical protein